jgi:hypothetical protein
VIANKIVTEKSRMNGFFIVDIFGYKNGIFIWFDKIKKRRPRPPLRVRFIVSYFNTLIYPLNVNFSSFKLSFPLAIHV